MWTVERACMMGMQKSDIYSERNRHCVSGCRVACSMFHAATRVLCVSNSRQLAYPGLSYRPIRYLHPMRYNRGRDGAPARGRRAKDAARAPRTVTKNLGPKERPPTRVGCDSLDLDFHLGVPPVRFFTARSLASRSVRSRSTTTARKSITPSRECWAAHWAATSVPRNSA
jgi:hypothetical protein